MRLETLPALTIIAIVAAVTLFTRAAPFWLFPASRPVPPFIAWLGRWLPAAMMGMLVVYCLKGVTLAAWPHGLPETIALAYVFLVHRWKHNLPLSIGGGTALYMLLVQTIFS